jgi:hypothetical protein
MVSEYSSRNDTGQRFVIATPPTDCAKWFKLISVPLGNYDEFGQCDWVGAVTAWQMPATFDGISASDLPKVQDAVDAGDWAKSSLATNWVGRAIGETLDISITEKLGKARVQKMLAAWISSGALKEVSLPNKNKGRDQTMIVVGNRV